MSTLSANAQAQALKTAQNSSQKRVPRDFRARPTKGMPATPMILPLAALSLALLSLSTFSSCSSRARLDLAKLPETGAITLSFSGSLSPTTRNLLLRFTGMAAPSGGGATDATADSAGSATLFDGNAVREGLIAAGMTGAKVSADGTSLAIEATARKSADVLGGAVHADAASRVFTLVLDRDSVNAALALMPVSARDYVDLLMAPAFTGEELSVGEYRDIVAATYGKTLETELDAAVFTLAVTAPGPVKTAKTGATANGGAANSAGAGNRGASVAFTGDTATFTLPLVALLVLEKPLTLEISW